MMLVNPFEDHRLRRKEPKLTERVRQRLEMQGFTCSQETEFKEIIPWLRLSPGLTTVGVAMGTALASPMTLLGLSCVTGVCAVSNRHPFDHLYNYGVRQVT